MVRKKGKHTGIADNVFTNTNPINGLRHNPENGTCGWYIWAGGEIPDQDDFFKPMHSKHLKDKLSIVIKYLSLEPGFRFQIDTNGYEDIWFDKSLLK